MSFVHALNPPEPPSASQTLLVVSRDLQLARIDDGAVVLPTAEALAGWAGGDTSAISSGIAEVVAASPTDKPEYLPRESNAASATTPPKRLYLGQLDAAQCSLQVVEGVTPAPPSGWAWHETRALLQWATAAQAQAIACGRQLAWWDTRHRHCGCCGTPTKHASGERARHCPRCGASFFPNAAPAVIVAVTRGDRLLLAHNRAFRPGLFSLLAGFVDPGETLEAAVIREVREETGIEVGALRYLTSQPWPFPNSLMVGFRATHLSGEIRPDGVEIVEAGWFSRDALPETPRRGTVARTLIDAWLGEDAAHPGARET